MKNVVEVHLSDHAQVFNGKTPARADKRKEGLPVLKIRDVDDGGTFRGVFESFVDLDFAERFPRKIVEEGDTLILNAAHNADYVGSKSYLVTEPVVGALATGEWLLVRPNRKTLDPRYAYHWITSDIAKHRIRRLVKGIHLYPKDVARLGIRLPPLDEQKRIAAILDQADALRRLRQRAVDRLDELGQAIFYEMFGDPVANSKSWEESLVLGEVAEIVSGITKGRKLNGQTTRQIPYLAVVNVQDKRLQLDPLKTIEATHDEIERYLLMKNDLLLTEGGDPDKLGRGTLWNAELPECIHQNHVFRVRLNVRDIEPLFLNWLVGSERGKRYFLRSAKQTTGIASINMTQLKGFPLILPPLKLQQEFSERICAVEERSVTQSKALEGVISLFQSLQQRALRGEL